MVSEAVRRAKRMKVRNAALRVLSALRINDIATIRDHLEEVCIARGVIPVERPLDGADGQLLRRADGTVRIVVNSRLQRQRKRFTLGHELGHHEQHGDSDQLRVCTSFDLRDYARDPQEIEANQFAAYLLMPPALFDENADEKLPSFELVRELALGFDTSITATARRVVECSTYRVAVVASTPKGVWWWDSSDRFRARIDRRSPRLSPKTMAHKSMVRGLQLGRGLQEVDPAAWLEDYRGDSELHESCVHMPSWDMCLSLLVLRG
jgi:Zn-dependent peptidase ImmA (M78 family)